MAIEQAIFRDAYFQN